MSGGYQRGSTNVVNRFQKTMAECTVEFFEQSVKDQMWCGFHGCFHPQNDFSTPNQCKPRTERFCLKCTSQRDRDNADKWKGKTLQVPIEQMRKFSKGLKLTITDLPAEAPAADLRGSRLVRRQGASASNSNGAEAEPVSVMTRVA